MVDACQTVATFFGFRLRERKEIIKSSPFRSQDYEKWKERMET